MYRDVRPSKGRAPLPGRRGGAQRSYAKGWRRAAAWQSLVPPACHPLVVPVQLDRSPFHRFQLRFTEPGVPSRRLLECQCAGLVGAGDAVGQLTADRVELVTRNLLPQT